MIPFFTKFLKFSFLILISSILISCGDQTSNDSELSASCSISTNGLAAYFPITENDFDSSGILNYSAIDAFSDFDDGINVGNPFLNTDRFNQGSSAFTLVEGDFANIYDFSHEMTLSNGFTLSAWINPERLNINNLTEKSAIISRADNASNYHFTLALGSVNDAGFGYGISNYLLRVRNADSGDDCVFFTADNSARLGEWYQISASWSGGENAEMYIDGEKQDLNFAVITGACPANLSLNTANISQAMAFGVSVASSFFIGSMDDIRIYDSALSESEIKGIYECES